MIDRFRFIQAVSAKMTPNPFSTRFIQPGAISYRRFDGGSLTELAERFLELPTKRAIIFGPHGSGKSTLVASLVDQWNRLRPQQKIHQLRFTTSESPTRSLNAALRLWTPASIVILDGYEQLRFWSRTKITWHAKYRSIRILATAHRLIPGFVPLWQTSVCHLSSHWVIEHLLAETSNPESAARLLDSDDWKRSRAKHGQNLRESLFDMYDWWQRHDRG
jgi:hypothetical protein